VRVNTIALKAHAFRGCFFLALLPALFTAAGCATSVNFTPPLEGRYVIAPLAAKDYEAIGTVRASSVEIHRVSPFGFVRRVEGSKITFADLLQEAARINADDIIDVRIDMNVTGRRNRVFTYTGKAVAIRYVGKDRSFEEYQTFEIRGEIEETPAEEAGDVDEAEEMAIYDLIRR